jgi:hypothetical protein
LIEASFRWKKEARFCETPILGISVWFVKRYARKDVLFKANLRMSVAFHLVSRITQTFYGTLNIALLENILQDNS